MVKNKHQIIQDEKEYNLAIVALIIVVSGFIIYCNALHASFAFDDHDAIIENFAIRNNSLYTQFNQPRYIGLISFALNYHFNHFNTHGYHLVNILIHIINALLVYLVIQSILKINKTQSNGIYKREIPLVISFIFLVHPIQTQSVTYIVQRYTSLAALFTLVSIFFYLKFRSSRTRYYLFYILSCIACLLAFKTKENTATLPLCIIAIEALLFRNEKISRSRILHVFPYFLLIAVIPLSFINMNQPLGKLIGGITEAASETTTITRTQYIFTEFRVMVIYMRLLVLPINQSIDYLIPLSQSFFEIKTFLAFCFLILILICAFLIAKRYPFISLGIFWFFIFLAVESSVIPISDVINEHRLYLPSIGFISMVVYSFFLAEKKSGSGKISFIFFAIIILALSASTYQRNKVWNNEISLWEDTATKFPEDTRAWENLGAAYMTKGMYTDAMKSLEKAIEINPQRASQWFNLAMCHKALGLTENAVSELKIALELNPQYQKPAINLAIIYIEKKQFNDAYDILIKAKNYAPTHPYINALLAQVYCEMGETDSAISLFDKAMNNGLEYGDIYNNISQCLSNK